MNLRLYNSFTNKIEDFNPINSDRITMYNCGPTVYDYAHIGNFRSFLMADLLRRVLELNGYNVVQVMNITDVGHMTQDDSLEDGGEDKMVTALKKGASVAKVDKKDGYKNLKFSSPWEVADFYIKAFMEDFKALNFLTPHHFPRATDYIDEMVKIVKTLVDKKHAYCAEDGTYYFDVTSFKQYGKLSNNTLKALQEGAGGRVEEGVNKYKRQNFDFALWKKDDAHIMKWDTELGSGFPGWHIECTAMSLKLLGNSIDFHTGGEDNKFPHHECEIAQSEAYTGERFVNYWLHAKFLQVEGEKMAKSKGNFYTIPDLLKKGYHPLAIRWVLMSTHYSQTLNFTLDGLETAHKSIKKLVALKDKVAKYIDHESSQFSPENIVEYASKTTDQFKDALNNNLNISSALAVVFGFVNLINKQISLSKEQATACMDTFKTIASCLGVIFDYQEDTLDGDMVNKIESLIADRNQARKNKDYALADQIRSELIDMGIEIQDSKDGTSWKKL